MDPIRYARSGDVRLAYQQYGNGPVDVLGIPPFAQNIELMWERPEYSEMFERIGRYARVVHFDERGTGMSDRGSAVPTLDERVEDVRAVMDAAGLERAVVMGVSEGGPAAVLFARTYPERVTSLVLRQRPPPSPNRTRTRPPWRPGTPRTSTAGAPNAPSRCASSPRQQPPIRATSRGTSVTNANAATPAAVGDLLRMLHEIDVRPLLSDVDVPVLVLHATGDPIMPVERAREMAAAIPGARFVEWAGVDHFPQFGETDVWHRALEEFLTGLPAATTVPATRHPDTQIRTFGGFAVTRDGVEVPIAAWGSRRARQLCKRLAAAAGAAVTRDELFELLWPGDRADRGTLGARLSVQLAAVRRVLGGGVIADRTCVRLDTTAVHLDLVAFAGAIAGGRHAAAVRLHNGPFLPEDPYDDWAITVRDRTTLEYRGSSHPPHGSSRDLRTTRRGARLRPRQPRRRPVRRSRPPRRRDHAPRPRTTTRRRNAHTRPTSARMIELDVTPQPLADIAAQHLEHPYPSDNHTR